MFGAFLMISTLAAAAMAASLQQVHNFGSNPSGTQMFIYVPDVLPANPAVVVVNHACHGSAEAIFNSTTYAASAQELGYIAIYPQAPSVTGGTLDACWDVSSNATLTRFGGGDSFGIWQMTQHVLAAYGGDRARVFATGVSSGAMMTNVLLALYPDVFGAGSAFAGVAYGCFADPAAAPDTWSTDCATGLVNKTARQWGDLVRAAFPGFRGPRPLVQLWHGTLDTTLQYPQNLQQEIKEWTDVFGIPETPTATRQNYVEETWVGQTYGTGQVQVIIETGQTHNLVVLSDEALKFFGFHVPSSRRLRVRAGRRRL